MINPECGVQQGPLVATWTGSLQGKFDLEKASTEGSQGQGRTIVEQQQKKMPQKLYLAISRITYIRS